MPSIGLKLHHSENYINCKCSAVQLKDTNQMEKRKKKLLLATENTP